MSFYWKTRTLISGDYREVEGHLREWKNQKTIKKYKGNIIPSDTTSKIKLTQLNCPAME